MKQLSLECFIHGRWIRMFWVVSGCVMCILAPAIYSWIDNDFYRVVSGGEEVQFPGLQSCWGQPSSSDNSTSCLFFFFIILRSLCIIDVKPKVWPEAALSWIELLRRKIKSDFFIIADLPAYPASISQFSTSLPVIAQAIVKSHNISTYQATLIGDALKTTQNRWWHHVVKNFIKNVVASVNIAKSPEPQVISVINIKRFSISIISRLGIGIEWPMLWL